MARLLDGRASARVLAVGEKEDTGEIAIGSVFDDMVQRACRLACRDGFANVGQRVIIVAGVPLGTPGATNMLRIAFVGAEAGNQ